MLSKIFEHFGSQTWAVEDLAAVPELQSLLKEAAQGRSPQRVFREMVHWPAQDGLRLCHVSDTPYLFKIVTE